ncbi:hypothetical protein [Alicycliphilus denitrificans]|uniref:hypothetical protein n=1 Tax=Alicycliphilus denitrificans TaxID=179636 RepID=UPI00384B8ABC
MSAVATPAQPRAKKAAPATVEFVAVIPAAVPGRDTFASHAFYRASEAEAVLRTAAEDGDDSASSNALWGVMTLVGQALTELEMFHITPTYDQCFNVRCLMDQAIGILVFFDDDLVVDAGGTLLVMARDMLVKGMEGLSHG